MGERVPTFLLLVPGPWSTPQAVLDALRDAGVRAGPWDDGPAASGEVRVDVVQEADGFAAAMAYGRAGQLPQEVIAAAGGCTHAALIEVGRRLHEDLDGTVALGEALQAAGGVAVRTEFSGGAATWAVWLNRLRSGDPMELCRAATVIVGGEDDLYFTCGMHHFDLPDAQLRHDDPQAAIEWLELFSAYQLAEAPTLATGHTFSLEADAPRRTLERWPDATHHRDDGRHNPFGCWHALEDPDAPLPALDPVPVIMPSLSALLLATQRQHDRPLTEAEVTALVDGAPAISMSAADALALERSRGYADLEPRRAWAQWQSIRDGLLG